MPMEKKIEISSKQAQYIREANHRWNRKNWSDTMWKNLY